MSIENQWGNPAENFEHMKSEYLKTLAQERDQARKNEEDTLKIIESIENAIKLGNTDFIQKALDVLKKTATVNKDLYLDTLDELEQAKIEGAEFMKQNLN